MCNGAPTALRAILTQAGLRPRIAGRIERLIESDDYIGLTGDDVADVLMRWKEHEADRLYRYYADQAYKAGVEDASQLHLFTGS